MTARDLVGEKPVIVATRERIHRDEVQVEQIMTARADLQPLHIHDVQHAAVGGVAAFLRGVARQHAVVVEPGAESASYTLVGIFSITQIGRQLGVEVNPDGHVRSFAELEHLLVAGEAAIT